MYIPYLFCVLLPLVNCFQLNHVQYSFQSFKKTDLLFKQIKGNKKLTLVNSLNNLEEIILVVIFWEVSKI